MPTDLRAVPNRVSDRSTTLRDLAAVFFRHQKLFVVSFVVVLVIGMLWVILAPSYKAEMKILVRRGRIDPAITPTETAPLLDRQEISEEELNSEAELLKDEDILREVVITTGLPDDTSWLAHLIRGENREEQIAGAIRKLAKNINVQPVRKSHLITVSYKSTNAQSAAAVLKTLADSYFARHREIGRPTGQQLFFEQQMEESRRALDDAESQLIHFTRNQNVVSATLERDLTLQKLSEAQAADLGLQASIVEGAERIRSLEAKLGELPERRVSQMRSSDNPQLQEKSKSKLLELELKRTELLTKFQPSYRLVQEIEQQIMQTKAAIATAPQLRDETTENNPEFEWASTERTKNLVELQALLKRQAVSHLQVSAYKQAATKLGEDVLVENNLERKRRAAQDKYLLYANKREEARIGDALDTNKILDVTLAQEPRLPALPTWDIWAASSFCFAAACVLSAGATFVADYLDSSFRTPDEVVDYLGEPVLISLPDATGPHSSRKYAGRK